jgi:hypothetical protein
MPRTTLRSPADLIAVTPYLLGFHPTDSVVVIALRGRAVAFAARGDLPGHRAPVRGVAREIVTTVARQAADAVAVLGYGPAATADPLLRAVRDTAHRRGLRVEEVLRVDAGRWWSYLCENPRCCPPEGTPIDPDTSEVAAWCTFVGLTAAASRQDLARRVAPVGGAARAAMARATDRAEQALLDQLAAVPEAGRAGFLLAEGAAAVRAALERYAAGGVLDDGELARLGALLVSIPVRDLAWRAVTTEQPHLALWTDVTRRVDPPLVPAPASLLAFTAWRAGDGALAGLALERALREDPAYSLANLLLDALRQGLPPSTLDSWPPVVDEAEAAGGSGQVTRSAPA